MPVWKKEGVQQQQQQQQQVAVRRKIRTLEQIPCESGSGAAKVTNGAVYVLEGLMKRMKRKGSLKAS